MLYQYRVDEIIRVVDGDSIDCRLKLGFGLTATFRFRLAGIDTPEVYGREASARGAEASAFTKAWLSDAGPLTVTTFKSATATIGIGDGSFGRWRAAFVAANGADLASALRAAGFDG